MWAMQKRRSIIIQIGGSLDILKGERKMIKLEHVVLASSEQMEFIIEGMRNPMNSWNKTDSVYSRTLLSSLFI